MSVRAIAKGVRITPRKAGLVSGLVRGRTVDDALVILEHTPKKAAQLIKKVVESAKANAINNHNLKADSLIISEIQIGPGPAYKRYRPAAHGRANPYKRRTSHIRVMIDGEEIKKKINKSVQKPKAKTKETKETEESKEKK